MVTVADLLNFIAANSIRADTEVQVVRDASGQNAIDVEAMSITGLGLTADGWLRIDTH